MNAASKDQISYRQVDVEGFLHLVPRGIARNKRNRSWQVKIKRNGELLLSGNFTDDTYGSTSNALKAAVETVIESGLAQRVNPNNIKLTARVTINWAQLGHSGLNAVASVYNPDTHKGTTVYLGSQRKLAAGLTEDLPNKMVKALEREWQDEHGGFDTPMTTLIQLKKKALKILASEEWQNFMGVGAELAAGAEQIRSDQ
ncbi:hypothetical protein hairong_163 [Pseudomonas phage hairong]|nr:hypothetical protein hairong_163 [Pseudomonas phage hairong]